MDELREVERAANVAGTRLLLVGGEGAALLLAFTILAARGMRRDLEAARRRLTWFGAQRWQLWLLSGLESSAVAVVGVVLGWIVGIALSGIVAKLAGAPVADVLRESVLSPLGLGVAVATAVVAAVLVWITVSLPRRDGARVGVLDLVGGGCAARRRSRAHRRRGGRGSARARGRHGAASAAPPGAHRDRGGARSSLESSRRSRDSG